MMEPTNAQGADREEEFLAELLREARPVGVAGPVGVAPAAEHAQRLRQLIAARTVATPSRMPSTRRGWAIGATLAAAASILLLLFGLDGFRRQDSWAQVVKTVRERPWLHGVAKLPNGKTDEFWVSFAGQVSARKSPGLVRYDDYRTGIRSQYEVESNKLIRLPASQAEAHKSLVDVFQAIFRNDDKIGDSFAEFRILDQKRREVERDGRKWIEYVLKIALGTQEATLTIEVDLVKKLPVSMTLQSPGHTDTHELTFPDEGPADVYALGAPRDAVVDDRMPPAELATVLRALKLGRDHPHNYFGVVVRGGVPQTFVWRKGNRWRVDLVIGTERATRKPPRPDEKLDEWRRQYHQIPIMLCDAKAVYKNETGAHDEQPRWKLITNLSSDDVESSSAAAGSYGNAREAMAEIQAYPGIVPSEQFDLTLDPKPAEGPEGAVLLTMAARGNLGVGIYRTSRYWLDPAHGYAVARYDYSDLTGPKKEVGRDSETSELSDFVKSPDGAWYPTTIRRKNVVHEQDAEGKETLSDDVRTFYYDFKADLPDALFEKN